MAKRGPRDVQKRRFRTLQRQSRAQRQEDMEIAIDPGAMSQQQERREQRRMQRQSQSDHDDSQSDFE